MVQLPPIVFMSFNKHIKTIEMSHAQSPVGSGMANFGQASLER
jgi:hypothetical protein